MDYKLGFKGQYVSAVELGSSTPTLTIARVVIEKIEALGKGDDVDGKVKDRLVVYFREAERGWVMNRTNAECIVAMWGRDTDGWIGHKVTLYQAQVRVGPKMEPGIRVKGSPELDRPLTVEVKLPRKKPQPMTLVPTGKKDNRSAPDQSDAGEGK